MFLTNTISFPSFVGHPEIDFTSSSHCRLFVLPSILHTVSFQLDSLVDTQRHVNAKVELRSKGSSTYGLGNTGLSDTISYYKKSKQYTKRNLFTFELSLNI